MRETTAARGKRLLAALEELGRAEVIAVASEDFPALADLQLRAGSLLEELARDPAALSSQSAVAGLARFRELRRASQEKLAQRIAAARDALRKLQASGRQLSRITPAYAPAAAPGRAFTIVG